VPDHGITWGVLPPGTFDRVLVFSPHFDDAAMGAGHLLLAHPGSTVVTVFAGPPARYPDEPTEWDALGGFRAGDDVVAVRRHEDADALTVLGADHVWLEFATTST
jgi:LmbE family N-acetylglucosaminyl deacetylase